MNKINIAVVFGGRSGEHEVSLMSAQSVMAALNPKSDTEARFVHLESGSKNSQKYNVIPVYISRQGKWYTGENIFAAAKDGKTDGLTPVLILPEPGNPTLFVRQQTAEGEQIVPLAKLDVVFPVLHGTFGEDGTIQGLFELAEVAYVGAGVLASSVGMDKILFKNLMSAWGLPIVKFAAFTRSQIEADPNFVALESEKIADYPLFVKPANLGSSVGISKCHNRAELVAGLLDAARYDRRVLVEEGLNATELEVSVLGNAEVKASTPGEIRPVADFYSYDAKYIDGTTELFIPAPINEQVRKDTAALAVAVFKAIDGAGLARVDFLLDKKSGTNYVNEINTLPGFTSISMYPKLWAHDGIDYPALVDRLVDLALERHVENAKTLRTYGSES